MSQLKTKHLLGIKNLDREGIELIFQTAANFKEVINRPIKKVPSLRDVDDCKRGSLRIQPEQSFPLN